MLMARLLDWRSIICTEEVNTQDVATFKLFIILHIKYHFAILPFTRNLDLIKFGADVRKENIYKNLDMHRQTMKYFLHPRKNRP